MKSRAVRLCLPVLAAASLLCGCSVFDENGGWFSTSGKKSNLRGVRIPVMSLDSDLKPDPTLAGTPVQLPPPYINPDWPQPGGYASNAMYHLAAPGRLRQIWSEDAGKGDDIDSHLTSAPVVGGGLIYALDSEAHIYVFRATDGHAMWNRRLAPKNGTDWPTFWGLLGKANTVSPPQGMGGGVAYDDGKVFITSGFGVLRCMDARTGRDIWQKDLGMPIINAPVVNVGATPSPPTTIANLYRPTAANMGSPRASPDHRHPDSTNAAVSGRNGHRAPTRGRNLRAQGPEQPEVVERCAIANRHVTALSALDDIAGRPVIDRGVVTINQSGLMAAFNVNTGEQLWSRDIGGIQTPWAAGELYVYVLDNTARLICLTRKDGRVRWIHQLPPNISIPTTRPIPSSGRASAVSDKCRGVVNMPKQGVALYRQTDGTGGNSCQHHHCAGSGWRHPALYLYTSDAALVALR